MKTQTSGNKSVRTKLAKLAFVTVLAVGSLMPLAVSADDTPTSTPTPTPIDQSTQKPLTPIRTSPAQPQVSWNS